MSSPVDDKGPPPLERSAADGLGVFLPSGTPKAAPAVGVGLRGLSLQDVHEIRLLLRGDSVVDWYRLAVTDAEDVRRLLAVNSIDIDSPGDRQRLETLRAQAVRYIRDRLALRLDERLATEISPLQLPMLASGRGKFQRQACTLLKVMHIIYHLDARELRMAMSIPDAHLFSKVEQSVVRMFDELRTSGVPVREFSWSRKTRDSLITKLLVKRDTNAARVFDRLRFRVVVERSEDLIPTLHVLLRRFIPFNYVVPGQTVNTLVDSSKLERRSARARDFVTVKPARPDTNPNEFSGRNYQILNFVADLPVRVDGLLKGTELEGKGTVIFVLAEFQIMDRDRARANEEGENSHAQYKVRQHQRVRERLLREPKKQTRKLRKVDT